MNEVQLVSMTGFGSAHIQRNGLGVNCEIRTLNQRGLDVKVRLQRELIALEAQVLGLVKKHFTRGRIEVSYGLIENASRCKEIRIDTAAIESIMKQLSVFSDDVRPADVLQIEGIVSFEESPHLPMQLQSMVMEATLQALEQTLKSRREEGRQLQNALLKLVTQCEQATDILQRYLHDAPEEHFKLMKKKLALLLGNHTLDENRLYQEVAILADKTDVTEELERLKVHCAHFRKICKTEIVPGRQLDFLCQELLREANTAASKCQDTRGQHIVVNLKSDIERIREIVQNIE